MWALEQPHAGERPDATIGRLWATLGGVLAVTIALREAGSPLALAIAAAVTNGGLIGAALWGAQSGGAARHGARGVAIVTGCLVALVVVAAYALPGGALLYMASALWLIRVAHPLAVRPRAEEGASTGWASSTVLAVGVAVGALLGAHLLVTAAQAFGWRFRVERIGPVLAAFAYDAGANVAASECFFRGALFDRLQRRWSFWPAAALSTSAWLVRYLLDPRLPGTVEIVIGAALYLSLLGLANCWLVWWSGALVPAVVSSLLFFAAYRLLAIA